MSTSNLSDKNLLSYLLGKDLLNQGGSSIAINQRTTFVFAPNATGSQPPNVFTSWTALLSAVALTRGPITIQVDASPAPFPASITLPGGNLSGHNNIWLVGAPSPGSFAQPSVSITGQFTNGYVSRFSNMDLNINTGGPPAFSTTSTTDVGTVELEVDSNVIVTGSTGPLFEFGTTGAQFASIFLRENAIIQSGNIAFHANNGSSVIIWVLDNAQLRDNSLQESAAGNFDVRVRSVGGFYDRNQAVTGGILQGDYAFVGAANTQFVRADASDAQPCEPSSQTAPVVPQTDVIAARFTPRNSGKLFVSVSLQCLFSPPGPGNEDITFQLLTRTTAVANSAIVFTNGTISGVGTAGTTNACAIATGSGSIGYTVAMAAAAVHNTVVMTELAASPVPLHYSWSGYVDATNGTPFQPGQNMIVALSISSTSTVTISGVGGGVTPMTGSITVYELD